MGPNGSGKSTLAYSIAGHPKYTVTCGTVTLDGAGRAGDDRRRAGAGRAVPGHAVPRRGARRLGRPTSCARPRPPSTARRPSSAPGSRTSTPRSSSSTSTRRSAPARSTRASPAARRSATRSPSSSCSNPKVAVLDETDSGLDIDALKIVADGRQPLPRAGGQGRPADHPLHPHPALHRARLRARLRRRPDRRAGRPRARRGSSRPRATTSTSRAAV